MNRSNLRQIVDDIALTTVFLTRLPLPTIDFRGRTLAQAIWAAPMAGLVVALIGGLVYAVGAACGIDSQPAAALALASIVIATGCLHEDGLSDVADGFGGGRSREQKLEIMRDSRIGAYGAVALCLSLLIRWSALAQLASAAAVLCALVAAHMASRGLIGAFMHLLPPARIDGLAANAGIVTSEVALIGAMLGAVALLLLGPGGAVIALVLLGALFFGFRHLCKKQVGGQTGDTIGALQQLCEITILLVASACLS